MPRASLSAYCMPVVAGMIALSFAACGEKAAPAPEIATWGLTEDATIGGPTDSEGALSRVAAILPMEDGGIWILETSERDIRVHGADGKFVQRIGKSGDGPGEFMLPGKLGWWGSSKDTVWVSDLGERRLSLFDARGTFVRSMNMPFVTHDSVFSINQPAAVLADGTALQLAAYKPTETEWRDFPLVRYDLANGIVTKELLRVDRSTTVALRAKDRIVSTTAHPLSDAPLVAYSPDGSRVVVVDRTVGAPAVAAPPAGAAPRLAPSKEGEVSVLVMDTTGDTIFARAYPHEATPLPQAEADSLLAPRLQSFLQFTRMEGSLSDTDAEALFKESVKLPTVRPPVQSVFVGSDGSIWLGWAGAPGTEQRWTVLSETGDPVASVSYPRALDVRAVGKSWLWAAQAGGDGALQLVRYRVEATSAGGR
jgi:hypothetical protein